MVDNGSKIYRRNKSTTYDLTSTDEEYGVMKRPNIKLVTLGNYQIEPWYGNGAYFNDKGVKKELGVQADLHDKLDENTVSEGYWLDNLYVCEYCFKYTSIKYKYQAHRAACRHNKPLPTIGKLVYRDDDSPYLIRKVKGYEDTLFCQNLCLFGKLFLDDKSVFYNVDQFEYFVLYGFDDNDIQADTKEPNFKPMGFFSKETISWDGNNNLACICIFPPYQRKHLGTLLIEFLYAVAKVTPGQSLSGPEFPLSAFGKVSYYRFWSQKLSIFLLDYLNKRPKFSLQEVAELTGFRKEDIMLTLDYMKVLQVQKSGDLSILLGNIRQFCLDHKIDPTQETGMLKVDCLII